MYGFFTDFIFWSGEKILHDEEEISIKVIFHNECLCELKKVLKDW